MNPNPFTSEVPKVEGAYLLRYKGGTVSAVIVEKRGVSDLLFAGCFDIPVDQYPPGWEWCQLSPATAVKEGFDDGYGIGVADGANNKFLREQRWKESNARKIVEGEE